MKNSISIVDYDHLVDVLASNQNVVVKFQASWCGPCKMLGQTMTSVFGSNAELESNIIVAEVDVDTFDGQHPDVGAIRSVPVTAIFKNNTMLTSFPGTKRAPELESILRTQFNITSSDDVDL